MHIIHKHLIHVPITGSCEYNNGKEWMNNSTSQTGQESNGVLQKTPSEMPPIQHAIPTNKAEEENLTQLVQNAFNAMAMGSSFNRFIKGVRVLSASPPQLLAELTVAEAQSNDKETMHGGFTAALVDILTATSVRLLIPEAPIVSIDLSISYLAPAKLGEQVLLEATCLKAGRSIAFTTACFRRRSDNAILIQARQQLAILDAKPRPPATKTAANQHGNGMVQNGTVSSNQLLKAEPSQPIFKSGGSHLTEMQQLFTKFSTKTNFYQITNNLQILYAEPPLLVAEICLAEEHLNNSGTMHGGFTASMVDILTSRAVQMTENCPRVSLELSISYLLPAKRGEEVIVEAKCLKIGAMMAFTEAEFKRKRDGVLVAKGRHNMFMLRHKQQQKTGSQQNPQQEVAEEELGITENGNIANGTFASA